MVHQVQIFSLILQRKDYCRDLSTRQAACLLMEKRICQIKLENCFASLLRVIHTKYKGRRCRRQDLIFNAEYFLGRRTESTLFKRRK